jgi:hypothetical protein
LAAVNYLRGLEGLKTVLFISDGFYIEKGEIKLSDPFKIFGKGKYNDAHEVFSRFLKFINEENITFYTLSPRGLKLNAQPKETPWPKSEPISVSQTIWKKEIEQWSQELFTIEKIAEETGGIYLREAGKYEDFVKHFERDITHFYEIAYKPPRELKDGKYHKIEIKVRRPDLIVRYKKGYMDYSEKELEKRNLASAFFSPSFFKDIEFFCSMDSIPLADGNYQFWTRLKVPLNQFKENPPEELNLTFGLKEEEKFHIGETKLRLKEAIKRGVSFLYFSFATSPFKLKSGEYKGSVLLREGKKIGGWEKELNIPELNKEPYIINLIPGYIKDGVRIDGSQFTISKKDGALNLSERKFYPLVENEFLEGSRLALFLQIYNPAKIQGFPMKFTLYKEGEFISELNPERLESYFDKGGKVENEIYLLDFSGISPGQYKLKVHSIQLPLEKEIEIKILPAR